MHGMGMQSGFGASGNPAPLRREHTMFRGSERSLEGRGADAGAAAFRSHGTRCAARRRRKPEYPGLAAHPLRRRRAALCGRSMEG